MTNAEPTTSEKDVQRSRVPGGALSEDADPKLVATIAGIGCVCTIFLAAVAAYNGRYLVGMSVTAIAATVAVNLFLASRKPITYLQLNVSFLIIAPAMMATIYLSGSTTPPGLILLILVPFIMAALGSQRWMRVWIFVIGLLLFATYMHAPHATSHYVEPTPDPVTQHYLFVFVMSIFITGTAYALMGKRHAYLNALAAANARLVEARNEAQAANETKSQFLSRMSHELRTPLNAVIGFSEVMSADKDAVLTEAQIQKLSHIQESGLRLLKIVDEVLEITIYEKRDGIMALLPTRLAKVIAEVVNASAAVAQRNQVSISMDASSFQSTEVWSEPRALARVLSELLNNAIKFNRPGGSVTLRVDTKDENVRIAFVDNGIGISEQAMKHLFEPFTQLHPRETDRSGAGLGLATVRAITERMNAKIEIESEVGVGSTFVLVLRGYKPPSASPRNTNVAASDSPLGATHLSQANNPRPPTVLYIEDNQLNQIVMQAMFDDLEPGTLHISENGVDGLQQAQELVPDLLLIDIHLPDCNGIELLSRIRSQPNLAHIPAIAVSADAIPEHITLALDAGFNDYLTKPISLYMLRASLARHIQKVQHR